MSHNKRPPDGDAIGDVKLAEKKLKNSQQKSETSAKSVTKVVNGTNQTITIIPIPTSNQYAELQDKDDEMIQTKPEKVKKLRIPPITISNTNKAAITSAMKALKISDYCVKTLKHALNLYCSTAEDFKHVKEELRKSGEIGFYTHDIESDKNFRVVLYNLQSTDEEDLKNQLESLEIAPVTVHPIRPKNPRYDNHVDFVIHFKKGQTSLAELKKIKQLCFVKVDWAPYRNRRQVITQCTRCMRPGHGERNCDMPRRCEYCAMTHSDGICEEYQKVLKQHEAASSSNEPKTDFQMPSKCCNCEQTGHFATDPNCPRKIKYLEKRQRRASDNRTNKKRHVPDMGMQNFPKMTDVPTAEARKERPAGAKTFAHQLKCSSNPFTPLFSFDNSNSGNRTQNNSASQKQDCLSQSELMALLAELNKAMPQILSAPREVAVMQLMSIAIKFMYPDDGSK